MKRVLTSVVFLIAIVSVSGAQQPCADSLNIYTFKYQGRTYEIVKEMQNWTDAAACAVERGGFLVQINSQEEQDTIWYHITTGAAIPDNYTTVLDGGGVAYIWIGANDMAVEGTWIWDGNNDGTGDNFWTGQGAAGTGGGSAVGGAFVNWGGKSSGTIKEPDNYNNMQDAGAIALRGWPGGTGAMGIAGEWNDISDANSIYFIIEYDENSGVKSVTTSENFKVYPQPASDNLYVRSPSNEVLIYTVSIHTIDGKTVLLSEGNNEARLSLNVSDIVPGIYILSVKMSDKSILHQRIIIE